ncbi:T9SS type A sorting domain-containing protein, partial [Parasediminibacterium sp. JCM 36343]|uniref:T9SS type A sorting domain-containing protein n=1 Tax=Parasediminibacterium sp. JCM 36343 TaxID=3374279 RepID=UPI00397E3F2D
SYYEVQSSKDGKTFSPLLEKVSESGKGTYSYSAAAASLAGKLYYRIVVVNQDGSRTYSSVVAISLSSAITFGVYPNPVKSTLVLSVQNSKAEKVTVQVIDMQGKILRQQQIQLNAGISPVSLEVSSLSRGNYIVALKG